MEHDKIIRATPAQRETPAAQVQGRRISILRRSVLGLVFNAKSPSRQDARAGAHSEGVFHPNHTEDQGKMPRIGSIVAQGTTPKPVLLICLPLRPPRLSGSISRPSNHGRNRFNPMNQPFSFLASWQLGGAWRGEKVKWQPGTILMRWPCAQVRAKDRRIPFLSGQTSLLAGRCTEWASPPDSPHLLSSRQQDPRIHAVRWRPACGPVGPLGAQPCPSLYGWV